jgi:hypothetical protein
MANFQDVAQHVAQPPSAVKHVAQPAVTSDAHRRGRLCYTLIAACGFAAVAAMTPTARAVEIAPHLGYVYPAGGRQGTAFQVTVGGQHLAGVSRALVSGDGVRATVVEYVKPTTQEEATELRLLFLREVQKPVKDAETLKTIAKIRKKLAAVARPANPVIAETVVLQVTIAPDAEPGQRELRLAAAGLTNPLSFCVGQLPEFSKEASEIIAQPRTGQKAEFRGVARDATPGSLVEVALPATLNGQVMPGGADRYRFPARKGQQLVVAVAARKLIPYLADAVPGWFQPAITLYDAQGNELAYADRYRFHPDPVLHCVIPSDGQYTIEIRDAIYRGREDFIYRITIGELPFITGIFPLGGKTGAATVVGLLGWNLPAATLTEDGKDRGPGVYPLSTRRGEWTSNSVPFALDTLPECLETEPNNSPETAQHVTLPLVINGRIDQPGDWDVFAFEGRAGQQIVAEVMARRLDSPVDSVLKLTDAAGRQLAFNDDHEDKGTGLNTHHADSWLSATLPAKGAYYLYLGDTQHKGGLEYAYRLRIGPPRPDFELRIVPSAINIRGVTSKPLTVYALRKDGFSGAIVLALRNAPAGFALSGSVPANQDQASVTLSVPPSAPKDPLSLSLEGRATIEGREVVRPVVPAEDMMQAFAYRHLVPVQELKVIVQKQRAVAPLPAKRRPPS